MKTPFTLIIVLFIAVMTSLIQCSSATDDFAMNACELITTQELMDHFGNYSDSFCKDNLFVVDENTTLCTFCWEATLTGNEYVFDIVYFQNFSDQNPIQELESYLRPNQAGTIKIDNLGDEAIFGFQFTEINSIAFHNSKRLVVIEFEAEDVQQVDLQHKMLGVAEIILARI